MPTLITDVEKWNVTRGRSYNFVPYMDGRAWLFRPGEDFGSKPVSFVQSARAAAKRQHLVVDTKVDKATGEVMLRFAPEPPAPALTQADITPVSVTVPDTAEALDETETVSAAS